MSLQPVSKYDKRDHYEITAEQPIWRNDSMKGSVNLRKIFFKHRICSE
jgi:hypothetical protein